MTKKEISNYSIMTTCPMMVAELQLITIITSIIDNLVGKACILIKFVIYLKNNSITITARDLIHIIITIPTVKAIASITIITIIITTIMSIALI